jgi:hypothetical protein
LALGHGVRRALPGRAPDDLPIDLRLQPVGEEQRVRLLDRIELVVQDRDLRLAALPERGAAIGRGDHDQVERARRQLPAWRVLTGRHAGQLESRPDEGLVRAGVGGQARFLGDHHRHLEGSAEALIAKCEHGHDQERAQDEADDRARAPSDLDQLLADEGEDPGGDLEQDHAAWPPTSWPSPSSTSRANTSSNDGRYSRAATNSPPAART